MVDFYVDEMKKYETSSNQKVLNNIFYDDNNKERQEALNDFYS